MQILEFADGIGGVAAAWYTRHKEIALLIVGGFATFVFTRCLPWMFKSGGSIGVRALGLVSTRFRRKVALGEYLSWVILQNRDLNLTGIVGAAEKPQLEQVFISVKIQPTERTTEPPSMTGAPQRRSFVREASRLLKLVSAFLKPHLGGPSTSREGAACCAAVFSPKLFPSRRFVHLRHWADRYRVSHMAVSAMGFALLVLWPVWTSFISRSPGISGSIVAGIAWTAGAAVAVSFVRSGAEDTIGRAVGSLFALVFGAAVLAAIAIRFVRHDGSPIALMAASASTIVLILTARHLDAAPIPAADTQELGRLLHFDNIAILGKPGSGKSTLVQFLALTFGQARAGERRLKRRGVLRRRLRSPSWLMPVPIPLRKIAAFVENADPNVVGNLIIEGFRRNILPSGLRDKCDAAFFLRMMAARKCILLFDGLDEVSDDSQFQALTREIVGLISQYSGNKFLVTSRYAGWRGGVGTSFRTFDVEDLSETQTGTFIGSWYSAIEENRALQLGRRETDIEREYRASRAMERAGDLQQALSRSPSLRALAANPLLLSIICFVHSQRALPEERLSLYKECSNLLLGQWDREKGIPVDDTKLTLARKEAIMQEIAFALHSGRIGAQYGRKEATRQEILSIVSRLLRKFDLQDTDPYPLFEKLVSRSGVIVAVERYTERYAFSHLTFQEFYAAAYLFANQLDPFEAAGLTTEETSFGMTSWWSEVLALYGAMKRQSSDIVARLIDRSSEDRFGRRLRLGAQCMAESIEVTADVSDRLMHTLCQVRFGAVPGAGSLPELRRYLLRFASQPLFFERYVDWMCRSAKDVEEADRFLRLQCEGLRIHDTAIQSAALQGVVQVWRQWRISAPAVGEAVVAALKSTMLDLRLRGISFSIDLQGAGVLDEGARKAAIDAFLDVADAISGEPAYQVIWHRSYSGPFRIISRVVPDDVIVGFAGLATSVTRLLLPGEREAARERLWKILSEPSPNRTTVPAPVRVELELELGLPLEAGSRIAIAKCLALICSPEEIAEIRSDLGRGLNMGTGREQALLDRKSVV